MTSHRQHSNSASTLFYASQRPRAGSRLSPFLHGESTLERRRDRPVTGIRKPARIVTTTRHGLEHYPPEQQRSRSSTLSVIDPLHSPINFSRPLANEASQEPRPSARSYVHPAFASTTEFYPATKKHRHRTKHHHHHHKTSKHEIKRTPQSCIPHSSDPRVRQKSIGTLISGTLLTLLLTTYVALATSRAIPTTTFHALFIFFILLLTIIFAHFLIRLCMLSFPRRQLLQHRAARRLRDEEAGIAERYFGTGPPVHSHREQSRAGSDLEKALPPAPPPAYGRWRGSVRVDPELLEWRHAERMLLPPHTREINTSGGRPPSYSSEDRGAGVVPAPLFTGRGREREGWI